MHLDPTVPFPAAGLDDALAEYERAREQGRPLDRAAFLAAHPGIAAELGALLDADEQVDRLAAPVREALRGGGPLPAPALDGYELLAELGRGGMGVVYKARQIGTEQLVALKVLRPDWLAGLDAESRRLAVDQFHVEARAAASLRHPNRVRILLLGQHQGCPYYAMELIDGVSLAEKLKRPPGVSTEDAVRYLAGVADAVQEAHDLGIVHRDIKPHNILIEAHTDRALLADFGLALMERAAPDTVSSRARAAGTLPYMAPEQTEGEATPRSDIYGLGATLYEVLTGVPPFRGGTRAELLGRVRQEVPAPPSHHRPGVNPGLEAVCLRCLEKDPGRRFGSARDLAVALTGYLETIHYVRTFATWGPRMLLTMPLGLLPHLAVFGMLQVWFYEPAVWAVLFSSWVILIATLWSHERAGSPTASTNDRTYWAAWIAYLPAAAVIAVSLRTTYPGPPREVVLLMYPVLAALNGMAFFIEASRMPWTFRWGPFGYWLTGLVTLIYLPWAPLFYCAFTAFGYTAYAIYLVRLRRELGLGRSHDFSAHNPPADPA